MRGEGGGGGGGGREVRGLSVWNVSSVLLTASVSWDGGLLFS